MADVTINALTTQVPGTSDLFPFATTGVTPSTYKASLAQIKTALAIPTAVSQLTNDSAYITAASLPVTQQLAKAWVKFDGQGATSANATIYGTAYNVTTVYKLGSGYYRVDFPAGLFANANYVSVGSCSFSGGTSGGGATSIQVDSNISYGYQAPTTTSMYIATHAATAGQANCKYVNMVYYSV